MKSVIEKLLSTSAAFLLGTAGVSAAQVCGPQQGNVYVAQAESLLRQNESRKAYAYLNVARDQDVGEAFNLNARMFENGRGVKADPAMARHMNWMGAQSSNADSMFRTAVDFYERGLRKDGELWAKRAEACGHEGALILLTEKAILDGQVNVARSYLEKAIDLGNTQAKLILADQYDKGGLGLPKDHQRAFNWYYLAAKDGSAKAMSSVAYYFFRGLHGIQDETAAVHWYHEAAKAGHVESMTAYGWMVANGKGAEVDEGEAKRFYLMAKAKGDKQAVTMLANLKSQVHSK